MIAIAIAKIVLLGFLLQLLLPQTLTLASSLSLFPLMRFDIYYCYCDYIMTVCESTCIKLFPHIARAARRDASRESSQIDANRFAILLLVVTPRKKKGKEESQEERERMRGYLVEKG